MRAPERRKWLPAEAYRLLALAALRARGEDGATKRELAWETRANHYMITRVLVELRDAGLVEIAPASSAGYRIRITAAGAAFHERHRDYARASFGAHFAAHFRYGRRPAWAAF